MSNTNKTLEALIKALELLNAFRPILDAAVRNELARKDLDPADREKLYKLTKALTAETAAITAEDMGDGE